MRRQDKERKKKIKSQSMKGAHAFKLQRLQPVPSPRFKLVANTAA